MTTPQEEAERRYHRVTEREAFVAGAEWQAERLGPLVEAARGERRLQERAEVA